MIVLWIKYFDDARDCFDGKELAILNRTVRADIDTANLQVVGGATTGGFVGGWNVVLSAHFSGGCNAWTSERPLA